MITANLETAGLETSSLTSTPKRKNHCDDPQHSLNIPKYHDNIKISWYVVFGEQNLEGAHKISKSVSSPHIPRRISVDPPSIAIHKVSRLPSLRSSPALYSGCTWFESNTQKDQFHRFNFLPHSWVNAKTTQCAVSRLTLKYVATVLLSILTSLCSR
jgi:hypothetical protein